MDGYELIITEKPRVSQRIAEALATSDVVHQKYKKVSYYEIERNGKKIIIAPAVGHLFSLKAIAGSYDYPIFDIEWVPTYKANKAAAFTYDYLSVIKKLAKDATSFVNACDFDIEGSLIGYNSLLFLCGEESIKKAHRVKFSTLMREELISSYEKKSKTLDFPMVDAGITRHTLDWLWGVNISRALSHTFKATTGRYVTLSAGRVQTPTLKILNTLEKKIKAFVPEPYWVLDAKIKTDEETLEALHKKDKFFDENEAKQVYEKCKDKNAKIDEIKRVKTKQKPPTLFNLGDLQTEAYRVFKTSPKMTQQNAQSLYEQGLISYPRTSSQKLPKGLDPKTILNQLKENPNYKALTEELLKEKSLKPNEGKKTDPAHPCIYPTGSKPRGLNEYEKRQYDLIVKRFLASFGKPAVRETQTVNFDIGGELFITKGTRTIEKNWHEFYAPYVKLSEVELPPLNEGDTHEVEKLQKTKKETKPPSRFTPASIIKKMEDLGIGTKATRANILQTLYDRQYLDGTQIKVTDLGAMIIKIIEKYIPEIASEQLTKKFQDEMDMIRGGDLKKEEVITEAKETLTKILEKFREHQITIGENLRDMYTETERKQSLIGKCSKCGSDLIIRVSRASGKQFVGCSGYPKCTESFPLPQNAKIIVKDTKCPYDGLPVIQVIRRAKRPYKMCIDPKCESKAEWGKKKKAKEKSEKK